jgi:glutamine amidotransferase
MIKIIDFGVGNLNSIKKILNKINLQSEICSSPEKLEESNVLILPGVGNFENAIKKIKSLGFYEILNHLVIKEKKIILGICLGMQLFFEESEESTKPGFSWINGSVKKFEFENISNKTNFKTPHMGWNSARVLKKDFLFKDLNEEPRFYFAHSYHVVCKDKNHIVANTQYGYDFCSIVNKENIWGVQFHPEKSHKFGINLLKNFFLNIKNA